MVLIVLYPPVILVSNNPIVVKLVSHKFLTVLHIFQASAILEESILRLRKVANLLLLENYIVPLGDSYAPLKLQKVSPLVLSKILVIYAILQFLHTVKPYIHMLTHSLQNSAIFHSTKFPNLPRSLSMVHGLV